MDSIRKDMYLSEFSKTMSAGENHYLSFYPGLTIIEEFELLFSKIKESVGESYFPIYRMCDAEYMYCVGRKLPPNISISAKVRYTIKTILVNTGIINQKTGHENRVNKEVWFGENYSIKEKKQQKQKFINDLRVISDKGYLAPYFIYSKSHFAEEYLMPMMRYFKKNDIFLSSKNYFPFYFVYLMMNASRYKKYLFENRDVLIITAFNERNKRENFLKNLEKEKVKSVSFYNISHDKAMLEIIDKSALPKSVDLVLIGAGIGSANIMCQLSHLKAVCIDAGHALDCISRPKLRRERMFLLPDTEFDITYD